MAPAGRQPAAVAASAFPTGIVSFTSAPAFSSTRTTSMRPSRDGEQQRREAGRQRGAEIGARLDQRLHDRGVALGRRPHQRRLPAPVVLGVDTRAVRRAAPSPPASLPVRAAVISGVSPPGSAAFGSAPAFSSSSTIAPLPFVQASESGVTP